MYPFGTWKPAPSAMSAMPINSKKLSASILTVGWRSMKSASGFAAASMSITAMMIAAAMTQRSFAIPTAVITLSSENTTSRTTIWVTMPTKLAAPRALLSSGPSPSSR